MAIFDELSQIVPYPSVNETAKLRSISLLTSKQTMRNTSSLTLEIIHQAGVLQEKLVFAFYVFELGNFRSI